MALKTLILDAMFQPHSVVGWQRAITLMYQNKAEVLETHSNQKVSSPSVTVEVPSVMRLHQHHTTRRRGIVRFSRVHVMTRDNWRCQYCGVEGILRTMTYDHVIPRSRGGRTSWDNVVCCCKPCNQFKGDRTPEEAGMKLLKTPVTPAYEVLKRHQVLGHIRRHHVDITAWHPYLGITTKENK